MILLHLPSTWLSSLHRCCSPDLRRVQMYVIQVLEGSEFVEMSVAGKFARKDHAEGAKKFAERMGEKRPMRVELVNPGKQGNKGRTEHGAELATQEAKLEAKRAKNREYMKAYYQRKKQET